MNADGTEPRNLTRTAEDADDDGRIEITDAIYTLEFLFQGGRSPFPAPFPEPGRDPTPDGMTCLSPTN